MHASREGMNSMDECTLLPVSSRSLSMNGIGILGLEGILFGDILIDYLSLLFT